MGLNVQGVGKALFQGGDVGLELFGMIRQGLIPAEVGLSLGAGTSDQVQVVVG